MSKLVQGEQVRIRTRAHAGVLVAPTIWFILIAALFGFWRGVLDAPSLPWVLSNYRTVWIVLGGIAALAALFFFTLRPLLRWASEVYEVTTHRVAQRYGIINIRRRWIALSGVAAVRLRQSRRQRKSGTGNLELFTTDGKSWTLKNIPHVEKFVRYVEVERSNYLHRFGSPQHYGYQQGQYLPGQPPTRHAHPPQGW